MVREEITLGQLQTSLSVREEYDASLAPEDGGEGEEEKIRGLRHHIF